MPAATMIYFYFYSISEKKKKNILEICFRKKKTSNFFDAKIIVNLYFRVKKANYLISKMKKKHCLTLKDSNQFFFHRNVGKLLTGILKSFSVDPTLVC